MDTSNGSGTLRQATSRVMQASRPNAQLIGVIGAGVIAVVSGTWFLSNVITKLQTQHQVFQTQLLAQNNVFDAKLATASADIARARAEAIQEANEKFLTYGWAAEYTRLQQQALGHEPEPEKKNKSDE